MLDDMKQVCSYFSLISHKPPMVTVSVGVGKDTCTNVLATKEFVVNIVSEAFAQAMNSTAIDGPPELDEWEVSGLTPHSSVSYAWNTVVRSPNAYHRRWSNRHVWRTLHSRSSARSITPCQSARTT